MRFADQFVKTNGNGERKLSFKGVLTILSILISLNIIGIAIGKSAQFIQTVKDTVKVVKNNQIKIDTLIIEANVVQYSNTKLLEEILRKLDPQNAEKIIEKIKKEDAEQIRKLKEDLNIKWDDLVAKKN